MRWTDDALFEALGRYEQLCIRNGMRQKAVNSYRDYASRFLRWRMGDYLPRGSVSSSVRPTARIVTLAEIADDAKAYEGVVSAARREQPTVDIYYRHAMFFGRWLDGTFVPGARVANR